MMDAACGQVGLPKTQALPLTACGHHRAVARDSASPFAGEHTGAFLVLPGVAGCEAAGPGVGSRQPRRALSHGGQWAATGALSGEQATLAF